jgi:hypothetical protein
MGKSIRKEEIQKSLKLAQLLAEKCELSGARDSYAQALQLSKEEQDLRAMMEALSGLLRLSSEALDQTTVLELEKELGALMAANPRKVPPMAWYCKGAIARDRGQFRLSQRFFHRYLKTVRLDQDDACSAQLLTRDESIARAWSMLAIIQFQRGKVRLAKDLGEYVLAKFGDGRIRTVRGIIALHLGKIAEREKDITRAFEWYQEAYQEFLAEHNWYYHLYALYAFARISRLQQNYKQAYWYLDLIQKAAAGQEFGVLRREIALERARLEQDAVDLLIDSRAGVVQTREVGAVSLRKQYVLLNILEALSGAHRATGPGGGERGLSKAEIIEQVWREPYRPEAHDNKLYYNINRLRKLIEPDMRKPKYLLNWREGYRLAPGLKVQLIGGGRKNG